MDDSELEKTGSFRFNQARETSNARVDVPSRAPNLNPASTTNAAPPASAGPATTRVSSSLWARDDDSRARTGHEGATATSSRLGWGSRLGLGRLEKRLVNRTREASPAPVVGPVSVTSQATDFFHEHQQYVLSRLRVAEGASFDSYANEHLPTCHWDTRVDLLDTIGRWMNDADSKCIFWLCGMAGTGKSTISRTVAQTSADFATPDASFFFKRGEAECSRALLFFPTIASQLVQRLPIVAPYVRDVLEKDPGVASKGLKQQFERLILKPFRALGSKGPTTVVIVVDALDECTSERDQRALVGILAQAQSSSSPRFRIFLTSRPEVPIRLGFRDIDGQYNDFQLHEVPESIMQHDLAAFLKTELETIRNDHNDQWESDVESQLPSNWPGNEKLETLVKLTTPLFISAATACRFIADYRRGTPSEQLAELLQRGIETQRSNLDETYLSVLSRLFTGLSSSEQRRLSEEFRVIVGSIVLLESPLSPVSCSELFGTTKSAVKRIIRSLHSVLRVPESDEDAVRLFHLSFREFLLDPDKRKNLATYPFHIDGQTAQEHLARRCIALLSSFLKQNICDLPSPGVSLEEVDRGLVNSHLTPSVKYSCLYWVSHLKESGIKIRSGDFVDTFLRSYILYWLEALVFLGATAESISWMDELERAIRDPGDVSLVELVYDAKRFILRFRVDIEDRPLQIYSAALLFTPQRSVIRTLFWHCTPRWISKPPETDPAWDRYLLQVKTGRGRPRALAFSPDFTQLAIGSELAGGISVVNPLSGRSILDIKFWSAEVLAYSPDSRLLALCSYEVRGIRIWDTVIGKHCVSLSYGRPLEVSLRPITSIVFSSSTDQLLSNHEGTLLLWSLSSESIVSKIPTSSGFPIRTFLSADCYVTLQFQIEKIDGEKTRTVSVERRDTSTGVATITTTLKLPDLTVNASTVSPDLRLLAAASDDTMGVYELATGVEISRLTTPRDWLLEDIAFSPNSKLIASATRHQTALWIYDLESGSTLLNLNLRDNVPYSSYDWGPLAPALVFSPDSKLLACPHLGGTAVWDLSPPSRSRHLVDLSTEPDTVSTTTDKLLVCENQHRLQVWHSFPGHTVGMWLDIVKNEHPQREPCHVESSPAISMDETLLAHFPSERDSVVEVLELKSRGRRRARIRLQQRVSYLAFSPDSRLLVAGPFGTSFSVFDLEQDYEGAMEFVCPVQDTLPPLSFSSSQVYRPSISPDSTLLAVDSDWQVDMWTIATGEHTMTCTRSSASSVFSPDSKLFLVHSDYAKLSLFDTATGSSIWSREMSDSDGCLLASAFAVFSPDLRFIVATCGIDILVVDACSGATLVSIPTSPRYPEWVRFSADGRQLVTNLGSISWDVICPSAQPSAAVPWLGFGIDVQSDGEWISWNGKPMIGVPARFRPVGSTRGRFLITDSALIVSPGHRRTWTMSFTPPEG